MLFGLTNILVIFQAYINKALLGLLDTIYMVYFNNIIVYSNNYKVYTQAVEIGLYTYMWWRLQT